MSSDKVYKKLSKKQRKELRKLADEILEQAKVVVEDYAKNPSEISGSVSGSLIQIHQDSPFLDEE